MPYSLHQRVFEGSANGPHLLITGGVHGDEFEPMAAIRQLTELFQRNDAEVANFKGRLTLVPCVNEDAFLRGRRCASDELDLARTCPGRPDGSITERTAWALSQLIETADFYIDLHTGGTECALLPLAGYVLHADAKILNDQRRMARAFNLPVVWGTSASLQGRSLSVARDALVPAIYCEYLGSAVCSAKGVQAYVHGCLNVMAELEMLNRVPPETAVRHVVEDDAPESGHLQVCHPSPVNGYFDASVALGDTVKAGQPLGTVYELATDKAHIIPADRSGIMLMLRTFPRVLKGETVGVVLPTY